MTFEKISPRLQNFNTWNFQHYFEKLNVFPSKKHLAFLTIETYDIKLTNIKILDKNIVPFGGAQAPDFGMKYWLSKNFSCKFYYLW